MALLLTPPRLDRRLVVLAIALAALWLLAARPLAATAKDGDGEVRVTGVCGPGARSELRLRTRDDGIELRFKLDHTRRGAAWRVVVVQERRIAWKGTARTAGSSASFDVRRTLQDLPGADAVTVRAWGPRGLVCRRPRRSPKPEHARTRSGLRTAKPSSIAAGNRPIGHTLFRRLRPMSH